MNSVIHLVPEDRVGGVENAARTMREVITDDIDFGVKYIMSSSAKTFFRITYDMILTSVELIKVKPDLIILSLWKSCVVGLLVKLCRPKQNIVVLLHSSKNAHFLDELFTRFAVYFSKEVWGDSRKTIEKRFKDGYKCPIRVISFVKSRLQPSTEINLSPDFVFWGRLSKVKGLDRAIDLFSDIHKKYPKSNFYIVGPDDGEKKALRAHVTDKGLESCVHFLGGMSIDKITELAHTCSFYLQTSVYEGMAMSVVEAMQLGLVPIVAPVGEISNYCVDGENAIYVSGLSNEPVLRALDGIFRDPDKYIALRDNAVKIWGDAFLYHESVLQACNYCLRD